ASTPSSRKSSGTTAMPSATSRSWKRRHRSRLEQLACDFGHEHGPTVGWWLRWQQRRDALARSSVISSTLGTVRDHRGKLGGVPGGGAAQAPRGVLSLG